MINSQRNTQPKIAILLATYNGEKYIKDQLDSIIHQDYKNYSIFIRDDGSTDKTYEIISNYSKKYNNITIVKNASKKHGSSYNFLCLISYIKNNKISNYDYFMFCDQDDYWENTKIKTTLSEMEKHDDNTYPILVHSDLYVTDSKLNIISDSFIKYRCLNANAKTLNRLLIQNNITGCTIMVNKKLLELIPDENEISYEKIAMHDWWMALIACIFGKIFFIDKPTIRYRQHDKNVIGATRVKSVKFIIKRLFHKNYIKESLYKSLAQAREFKKCYRPIMDANTLNTIENFLAIEKSNKLKRIITILRYNYMKQGIIQKIGEILFI